MSWSQPLVPTAHPQKQNLKFQAMVERIKSQEDLLSLKEVVCLQKLGKWLGKDAVGQPKITSCNIPNFHQRARDAALRT